MAIAIHADKLSKYFGKVAAVDRISLQVAAGRIYGFLGPNGSGKSTTIRMLCGLLTPSGGDVTVLGYRMPDEAEALRQRIGYMTQKFSLYEDLTIAENMAFMAAVYSIPHDERAKRIGTQLDKYDLQDRRAQRAGTLSGGQKQRLALAAVTLHQPDLLLLDEPTSAVDPETRRGFWDNLFELAEIGTTILVSTHYMDEAERCHELAILDAGHLAAEGSPEELKQHIGMEVVSVRTDHPRAAREALDELEDIFSITQLGNRLHALVKPALQDPAGRVRGTLESRGLAAQVEVVTPSLEDVFVAATRPSRGEKAA